MEFLESFWSAFLSGSLLAGVTAVFLFKYKLKKAKNDSIRDDIKLNQEQMKYISELSSKVSQLFSEVVILKQSASLVENDNEIIKAKNLDLMKQIDLIQKELKFYKENCQCNINQLLVKLKES